MSSQGAVLNNGSDAREKISYPTTTVFATTLQNGGDIFTLSIHTYTDMEKQVYCSMIREVLCST